jgi:hypothetical protein
VHRHLSDFPTYVVDANPVFLLLLSVIRNEKEKYLLNSQTCSHLREKGWTHRRGSRLSINHLQGPSTQLEYTIYHRFSTVSCRKPDSYFMTLFLLYSNRRLAINRPISIWNRVLKYRFGLRRVYSTLKTGVYLHHILSLGGAIISNMTLTFSPFSRK